MINIIDMIDDLNEVEQDVLENIVSDLVSYTFSTRGGDQLIYLNKVYQLKKKLPTAAGPFRIQWRCKDRENCRTTVRLLSLRENLLIQAEYNIQSLGIEHTLGKLVTEKPVDFVGFDNVVIFNKNRQNDDNVVKAYKS